MPNIAIAPRPMVDPYAGKSGEILGDLFSTIGQIRQLRQQRNQTNAILDIMQSKMSPEEKQAAIMDNVRNSNNPVLQQQLARMQLGEMFKSPEQKALDKARLESTQALTNWRNKGGGARGASGDTPKDYTVFQTAYNNAAKLRADLSSDIPEDRPRIKSLEKQMAWAQRGMDGFEEQQKGGKFPRPPIGGIDLPAIGMYNQGRQGEPVYPSVFNQSPQAAPATGQPPSITPASPGTAGNMGPPMPPGFVNQNWLKGSGQQPGAFAQPEPYYSGQITEPTFGTEIPQQTKAEPQSRAGLDEIWDDLDDDSRRAAMELIVKGATPEQLIAHYKKKMSGK